VITIQYFSNVNTLHLSIILSSSLLFPTLFGSSVFASCIQDNDWPEKPCLDTPPYSESELKQIWDQYFQMKGKDWMEMKKAEMDAAIKDGTLKQWVEYGGSESQNFANFNVYFYYYLNGQTPDINSYSGIIRDELKPIISYYYVSTGGYLFIGIAIVSIALATIFFKRRKSKNVKI